MVPRQNKKDTAGSYSLWCLFQKGRYRSKAQQQQHSNDQKCITNIFCVICYEKVYQYQKKNGISVKFRKLDIAPKQPFQCAKSLRTLRRGSGSCGLFSRHIRKDRLLRRFGWRRLCRSRLGRRRASGIRPGACDVTVIQSTHLPNRCMAEVAALVTFAILRARSMLPSRVSFR